MAESDVDLSICTLADAGPKALRPLLASIHGSAGFLEFEILVAEEGDAGVAGLADEFPGLTVLRLGGLAPLTRLNRLIALSQGRHVLTLPAGALVEPHCLRRLVDSLDDTPEFGLLGPRLIDHQGHTLASCGRFPGLLALSGLPWPWPTPAVRRASGEVDFCQGGCHVLRRELLDEIGAFSPACGGLAELDLYWRARRAAWHAGYLHEAAVSLTYRPNRRPQHPARDFLAFVLRRWFGAGRLFVDKWWQ